MKPELRLLFVFVLCLNQLSAQYVPPLEDPLLITGTFGELRSNHFHGGLDFRGAVGTPVRSVADGYISRVTVSPGGFGQAVYVSHRDGKRSVYGHLEVLTPEIKDTIRSLQYETESFAIDFRPDSTAFPVERGEVIGGVGNRGHSFGPHLHFEIWDAATETQLNPLSLGFKVADTRKPSVSAVRIYRLNPDGSIGDYDTYSVSGGPLPDTIEVGGARIGVGIKAIDRQNSMPNRNGIYRANLLADSADVFSFAYDRIPYVKSRYVNALTDYAAYQQDREWFYLLYATLPDANFWVSPDSSTSSGVIDLTRKGTADVEIVAADYAGNQSVFRTVLKYVATAAPQEKEGHQYFLPRGEESIVDTAGMRLELPANALYTNLNFRYVHLPESSSGYLSDVYQLQDQKTPLHGRATLYIPAHQQPSERLRKAAYIGRCNADGSYSSVGGSWADDNRMVAQIGTFGDYAILVDTVPPRIRIRDFRTDLRGRRAFSLLIDDAVGGTLTYEATVDGKWILMEHDAKSGILSHDLSDSPIATGETHQFWVRVTDGRGNSSEFERSFRR
ncbi:M23 family metallopeptidase [Lewinella sp. IMCC34191]|uniref:M23 family metallopeptidase n=1 Tax=Lewinella sp. IMCC34191 TaxID=2259172 RepID=UPI000E23F4FE|nr:M23 family metallopeptidase [Lewinella sp. IMCC34191]